MYVPRVLRLAVDLTSELKSRTGKDLKLFKHGETFLCNLPKGQNGLTLA